jgi:hypothetical protein
MIFGCFRALLRQPAADISTGWNEWYSSLQQCF